MPVDYRLPLPLSLALFCVFLTAQAFYIPGWSIKSYKNDESVPLFVNKVFSDNTQLQYAYNELPFVCTPSGHSRGGPSLVSGHSISLNLGEVLRGDRIVTSDYELQMGKDDECHFLCNQEVDRKGVQRARHLVDKGYMAEWIVDNLPGATSFVTVDKSRKYYAAGFKMGYKDYSPSTGKPRYFINNHVAIVIRHRRAPGKDGNQGGKVIVGFEVYPKSVGAVDRESGCPKDLRHVSSGMELNIPTNATKKEDKYPSSSYHPPEEDDEPEDGATMTIPYTYSVYFREDEKTEWANRWDLYFVNQEESTKIHWLAILNSTIIAIVLTAVVGVILARTIRGEIKGFKDATAEEGKHRARGRRGGARSPRYSDKKGTSNGLLEQAVDAENDADVSSDEDALEDVTGWKLLHGDVFRPPPYGGLLAPLIGSGVQLLFMAMGLLVLSCLGILNPSFRGGFVSVGIGLFIFAGIFSGYFSGRVYRTFGGQDWKKNTLLTATLFPGLTFSLMFLLNLFVWAQASSTALPFSTLIAIAALWLGIQAPLVYVGNHYGYTKTGAWEHPTKTNAIPRQIPVQPWYVQSKTCVLIAGIIPFAVIFVELLFVFKSVWQDKSGYYYVFGFLSVVSTILLLTVIEVTVVATYLQLCCENYNWWWQSFLIGGGSSAWIFLYSVFYYFTKLHITGFISSMLFFSYSFLACAVYGLLTGTVGFIAAYAFVRQIYGAIKAD